MLLFVLVLLLIQTVLFLFKVVGVIRWDWDTVFIPIYSFTMLASVGLLLLALAWVMCWLFVAMLEFII